MLTFQEHHKQTKCDLICTIFLENQLTLKGFPIIFLRLASIHPSNHKAGLSLLYALLKIFSQNIEVNLEIWHDMLYGILSWPSVLCEYFGRLNISSHLTLLYIGLYKRTRGEILEHCNISNCLYLSYNSRDDLCNKSLFFLQMSFQKQEFLEKNI